VTDHRGRRAERDRLSNLVDRHRKGVTEAMTDEDEDRDGGDPGDPISNG
jgi:hypothetical protein